MVHFGIELGDQTPDTGGMHLTFDVLYSMELLKFDANDQGFFIQNEGDNFPVPNPFLTRIEGTTNRTNWKLDMEIHRLQDRKRPRVPISDEFQEFATHRLNDLYEGMTSMRQQNDEREQAWNNMFNAFKATSQQRYEQKQEWYGEKHGWHNQGETH